MILEEFGLPIAYEAAYLMQSVADPALPVSEMGELSIAIGQKLRSLAIMCLVTKGDPLLFGQNLTRSGRVRLAYSAATPP